MTLALVQPQIADSVLSRMDPRWKLAGLLPAAVMVALLRTVPAALLALLFVLALVAVARIPARWYGIRVGIAALLSLFFVVWLPFLPGGASLWQIGPLTISSAGLYLAYLIVAKAITLVTLMLLLWATAPFEATLRAAHALRVPGLLVHIVFLTYRYLFLLADEFDRLRVALRVRGFRNRANTHSYRTIGHLSGILLVRSEERAERVAQAMRCRGFDGQFRCLTEFRTRAVDVLAFFVLLVPIMTVLVWDISAR
jgi:cobalt/nickel transport system permease protein